MRIFASSLYIGLAALVLVALSVRVIRLRYRYRTEIGDGGHAELARAIRAHANFIEYVPLALLVILMADLAGHAKWTVHVMGIALIVGRVAHAVGFTARQGPNLGRNLGMTLTLLVLIAGAALALLAFIGLRVGADV
jgi:uncharacterized membrane protein YecN with MAPEG domain